MDHPEITILGIDPSTDITGVALVRFDRLGVGSVLAVGKFEGKGKGQTLRARVDRIRSIKLHLLEWVVRLESAFDLLAYEAAFWRGDAASEAIPQATGAYLAIGPFHGVEIVRVHGASVKAAYGNVLSGGKREDLKHNCIVWANQTFGLELSEDLAVGDDAIADAVAVAKGAWKIWAVAREKQAAAREKAVQAKVQRQQIRREERESRKTAALLQKQVFASDGKVEVPK